MDVYRRRMFACIHVQRKYYDDVDYNVDNDVDDDDDEDVLHFSYHDDDNYAKKGMIW